MKKHTLKAILIVLSMVALVLLSIMAFVFMLLLITVNEYFALLPIGILGAIALWPAVKDIREKLEQETEKLK